MANVKLTRQIATVVLNVVVALIGLLVAYPLVWMISASFKQTSEIYQFPPTLIPDQPTRVNYTQLFKDWPFGSWYTNSLLIALISTLTVLFFTSLAGLPSTVFGAKGRCSLSCLAQRWCPSS